MIDVNVDINGIVLCCDESILGLNIGHGFTLEKIYLDDLPYKAKITNAQGYLNIEYASSRLSDESGTYFICLKKQDIFQIDGPQLVLGKEMCLDDKMCSEQLEPYKEVEIQYLYELFAMLYLYKSGNIGHCDLFFDFTYKVLGIINNNTHSCSHNESRNIINTNKYTLTEQELIECNQFIVEYRGEPFQMLKPSIDEFIWGLHQIDEPTGFEQYTTALEMTLLEKNARCKKQKLANRVAILLGASIENIQQLQSDMMKFYRFRSDSLHEGDGSNISTVELQRLENIVRHVLRECLILCKTGIERDGTIKWSTIKQQLIDDLVQRVAAAKLAGTLPE